MSSTAIKTLVSETADALCYQADWSRTTAEIRMEPNLLEEATETRYLDNTGVNRTVTLTPGWWKYLEHKASQQGITIGEAYDLEQAALREIEQLALTDDFFAHVARVSNPAQKVGTPRN